MRAGDAKQRYDMFLRGQNEKNSLVMILPKIKEDKDVFSTAWVMLDRDVSAADADRADLARQSEAAGLQALEHQRESNR